LKKYTSIDGGVSNGRAAHPLIKEHPPAKVIPFEMRYFNEQNSGSIFTPANAKSPDKT